MDTTPTSTQPNPSESVRSRRAKAVFTEEDMNGSFGISSVQYRVGAPPLHHLPLVCFTNDTCRTVRNLLGKDLIDKATEVLGGFGITDPDCPDIDFSYTDEKANPDGNPDLIFHIRIENRVIQEEPDTAQITLWITTKWTSDAPQTWPRIVASLKRYINSRVALFEELKGIDIAVEMTASEISMWKYITPIPYDDKFPQIAADWPAIRLGVVKILDSHPATAAYVTAITLFTFGYFWQPERNPETVYISVSYESDPVDWPPVVQHLQEFVDGYKHGFQVILEHNIVTQFTFPLISCQDDYGHGWHPGVELNYMEKVNMGSEIGANCYLNRNDGKICNPLTGTVGCFLEIKTQANPTWTRVALTSYHVVRPTIRGFQTTVKSKLIGLWDGELVICSVPQDPVVESDLWATDRAGLLPSSVIPRELIEHPARMSHNTIIDMRSRSTRPVNSNYFQKKDFFDNDKQPFAQVWAGSGYMRRTEGNSRLDWALLKPLSEKRVGENRVPSRADWLRWCRSSLYPFNKTFNTTLKTPTGSSLGGMTHGEPVFKIGARTRYTSGYFNALKAECSLPEDAHVFSEKGQRLSTEYTYINASVSTAFAAMGDSGAVVFDDDGRALGIIFSGPSPQLCEYGGGFGFMTPIDEVFADIKKLSNGEITDVRIVEGQDD